MTKRRSFARSARARVYKVINKVINKVVNQVISKVSNEVINKVFDKVINKVIKKGSFNMTILVSKGADRLSPNPVLDGIGGVNVWVEFCRAKSRPDWLGLRLSFLDSVLKLRVFCNLLQLVIFRDFVKKWMF